jgi:hypothetical protein
MGISDPDVRKRRNVDLHHADRMDHRFNPCWQWLEFGCEPWRRHKRPSTEIEWDHGSVGIFGRSLECGAVTPGAVHGYGQPDYFIRHAYGNLMYRKFKNRFCFRANLLPNEARKRSGTKLKRNDVRTGLGEVNQCSGVTTILINRSRCAKCAR